MKREEQRTRRTRRSALALASWLALSLGCASPRPDPGPEEPPELVLAQEGAPPEGEGEKPPTDFVDFPTVDGLLPRDFVMEETSGAFKGCLTRFYRVRSQSGAELEKILQAWIPPKSKTARIIKVPQHNMLIITAPREQMAHVERVLEQVDVVPPQVEIEARVIAIIESDGYEYGFELLVDRAPAGDTVLRRYGGEFNSNSFLESLTPQAAPFQGANLNFASVGEVVEKFGDFEFIIRALESEGYAEIVSSPRIVCRSGTPAILKTATKLPIQDFFLQSTNNTRITTRYENVGVNLEVKPTVVGRDAITVEVKPLVSNVVRFELSPSGGIPVPVIGERSAKTTVDVRNGELLVIGGLLDRQVRTDQRRVPLLGSIPFLGKFFGSIDDSEQRTNVVFVLRIRILTSAEKARRARSIPLTRSEKARLEEAADDEDK